MLDKTLRVMVVDDHLMVHVGLRGMMEAAQGIDLISEASSAEEAIVKVQVANPDVILMDLILPGMDGIEATRQIKKTHPHIQIVVLTSYEDTEKIQTALAAGAVGYLLKNVSASELERAIRSAYEGRVTLAPEAAQALLELSQLQQDAVNDLTERELEVLKCLAQGLSNVQIADHLVVSPFTIKAHVSNILSKLGVRTRAEAAAYAVQHQLIKLP